MKELNKMCGMRTETRIYNEDNETRFGVNFWLFYGLLNTIFPTITLIFIGLARVNGIILDNWLIWILVIQIFLGCILLSVRQKKIKE